MIMQVKEQDGQYMIKGGINMEIKTIIQEAADQIKTQDLAYQVYNLETVLKDIHNRISKLEDRLGWCEENIRMNIK